MNETDDFDENEIDEMLAWMHAPDSIMKHLTPCPFCGKENFFWQSSGSYGQLWIAVKCDYCGTKGPDVRISAADFKNQNFEELFARWNSRK